MKKKYIAILDTETTFFGQEIFDIGLLIGDLKGNIVYKQGFVVKENIGKKWFYEEKRQMYLDRLNSTNYPLKSLPASEIFQEMEKTLSQFEVEEVYAYNAGFDTRVTNNLAILLNLPNPLSGKTIECLWFWSTQTILQQKGFSKFCNENPSSCKTEKGNFKTSAEVTFAYITKNPNFVEEHTAIEDCMVEYDIFLACRKQRKLRVKGIAGNPWVLVQTEEQIQKLPNQFRTIKLNLESQIAQVGKFLQGKGKNLQIEVGI